jgi:peptidoglycan/LPS O-acetylase OafA/YrhL
MQTRAKSATGRLAGLDVLRGVAAGAVMIHHHGQYYDELYAAACRCR